MAGLLRQLGTLFSAGGDTQIGIDVGASAVKVVALKNNRSAVPRVVGVAYEETPMGCVIDGTLSDTRTMAEVIRATLERAGIKYKNMPASVGMRGLNVVYKRLVLPFQRPEEMAQQVLVEAQQQVDSELSEWIIDYQILTTPDSQGQVAVMLVAAKRAAVEEYQALLDMVGVAPTVFDCDVFAIENAQEHSLGFGNETVMCLDVGQDSTKLNLIQDTIPVLVRSFPIGGSHLTEQLAKSMGIDFGQAESVKVSATTSAELLNQPDCASALRHHIDEICEEIKRTLEFFANSGSDAKIDSVDRVILSGGGAATRGMAEAISRLLNANISYANPFHKTVVTQKYQPIVAQFPHVFNVAVGLALRYAGDKAA